MTDFDMSQVNKLAADLGRIPGRMVPAMTAAVTKSGQSVRDAMRADAAGHRHAPYFPNSITAEVRTKVGQVSALIKACGKVRWATSCTSGRARTARCSTSTGHSTRRPPRSRRPRLIWRESCSMSNAHITAFKALLADPTVTVDDAQSPNFADLPRVVLYANQGLPTREALCATVDGANVTIQTTCVGQTREQAGLLFDKVASLVQDKRPVVTGWDCGPVQQLTANPAVRDDDVVPAVYYAVAQWRFHAVPA
jgi:hypothetical protein